MIKALAHLPPEMARAIWEGDIDWLDRNYHCRCCCSEHTYGQACPAWAWGGCRGYNASGLTTRQEERAWLQHYMTHHGMTEKEFYGDMGAIRLTREEEAIRREHRRRRNIAPRRGRRS